MTQARLKTTRCAVGISESNVARNLEKDSTSNEIKENRLEIWESIQILQRSETVAYDHAKHPLFDTSRQFPQ